MLTREQIQERLQTFLDPHYQQKQLDRVSRLAGNLSALGQILIQAGPIWTQMAGNYELVSKAQSRALYQLGALKPVEREELFKALFPKIAPQIEATWNLFDRLPYQTGYSRRPFRAPQQSALDARLLWFSYLVHAVRGYDQDAIWLAAWAPHLPFYSAADQLGYLFAGAIERWDHTGQAVFEILQTSANGNHEIGAMGRHVVRGMLCASRPEGWEFIERLLLAAQREEGLRQVILESVDEAHPQAFRRILRLVLEHNLIRFSAAVRAFDTWFGLAFETLTPKAILELLTQVAGYLDQPATGEQAIRVGSPQAAYFALWAQAFEDAPQTVPSVVALRQSPDVERRFVATHLLTQLDLPAAHLELCNALTDPDLRVVARAIDSNVFAKMHNAPPDLFERIENLLARLPHKQNLLKSPVWDWLPLKLERETVAGQLVDCLGQRSPQRLIPYLTVMGSWERVRVAQLLQKSTQKDSTTRQVLLTLCGDPSSYVREQALEALHTFKLSEAESMQLENLLTRQAEGVRRGVIQLLLDLPTPETFASIQRLIACKSENQRKAGLELLQICIQNQRQMETCRAIALQYRAQVAPTEAESRILDDILAEEVETYTLADGLGLIDRNQRTRPTPPPSDAILFGLFHKLKLGSPAAAACIKALDELVAAHRTDPIEITWGDTRKTELLGNVRWGFSRPNPAQPIAQDLIRLPLHDVWETWWQNRPKALRDPDGLELVRALAASHLFDTHYHLNRTEISETSDTIQKAFDIRLDFKPNYLFIVRPILEWLVCEHPCAGETDFLVAMVEASVSRIPKSEISALQEDYNHQPLRVIPTHKLTYLALARWQRSLHPETWTNEHHTRLWKIVRWLDEPQPGLPRYYPTLEDAIYAFQAQAATRDDLLDLLMGAGQTSIFQIAPRFLHQLSGRKKPAEFEKCPVLAELVDLCRERILSIEIRRGDLPTAASGMATELRCIPGQANLFRLLAALGKSDFERGYTRSESRSAVLSHLVRCCYPLPGETQVDFAALVRRHVISERRLVELAVYAPQWAGFVENTLGWPKLGEAVWWVYAHTKDRQWAVDPEIREDWAARVSEYTPLSADHLIDGAVDAAWFKQIYAVLGEKHWQEVHRAAAYASTGTGHARARLFADAMLERVTAPELIQRITQKRHQDAVRALGLVPIPGKDTSQTELLQRYEILQEFLRTSKKFGTQRQASEKLAVEIGMDNLARGAGFSDPRRLEWAMEIEAVADLAEGPVMLSIVTTQVALAINRLGEPELTVTKDGRPIKVIAPALKKDERVAALLERKQKLAHQISRMRQSLEQAMCRGDNFSGAELSNLLRHPMLRAMLEQIIFVGPSGAGYPVEGGRALRNHTTQAIPVAPGDFLRIAHPSDLLAGGEWHLWQRECFLCERIQPFKQVFRELYILTTTEKAEGNLSRRYAGQQVNPRQALALFGGRGWVAAPEEGIHKTFHDLGISARVGFLQGTFTPVEVEGLTFEAVEFTRRGEWQTLPLEQIPARIFSEVMRDLDLVVSVAHAGGVDPEASASSIEARTALIQETCALLKLNNVQIQVNHALIAGQIGNYTLHLGSGVVHRQPGGALCILPVHSQQRGRLFLPFVDNDPKTAEIISKVILLARDKEIKDPTILEQILR